MNGQPIIDAAVNVAIFAKTHNWPAEASPEFFEFANLLDKMSTEINRVYPSFHANIARQRKTIEHGND